MSKIEDEMAKWGEQFRFPRPQSFAEDLEAVRENLEVREEVTTLGPGEPFPSVAATRTKWRGRLLVCPPVPFEDLTLVISGATDCGVCIPNPPVTPIQSYIVSGCGSVNGIWSIDTDGSILAPLTVDTIVYPTTDCTGASAGTVTREWGGGLQCADDGPRIRLVIFDTESESYLFLSDYYPIPVNSPLILPNDLAALSGGGCGYVPGWGNNACITGTATLSW